MIEKIKGNACPGREQLCEFHFDDSQGLGGGVALDERPIILGLLV